MDYLGRAGQGNGLNVYQKKKQIGIRLTRVGTAVSRDICCSMVHVHPSSLDAFCLKPLLLVLTHRAEALDTMETYREPFSYPKVYKGHILKITGLGSWNVVAMVINVAHGIIAI
jgi:hypothetical protein